ncbi:FAD-dependent oxidoreductase [uncultured Sphingosinicella sp.]|uniref:NAD(P)/FAD-dependent oxidoreductase n=1 Tax=uncultured Sphingosinicella sp. TaxID=478748 RepID=UPI0030D7449F|tara:strand:- start:11297 stop:12532 length:1236 start_codon:yes stop_codon:yes gene_type:complete
MSGLGFDVVIVGGGHGGAAAASSLRLRKFDGTIAIAGDERELPYDRPPLSKEYLLGEKSWDRLPFKTAEKWQEADVTLLQGHRVVSVDADAHVLTTADGRTISYGTLIWSAGGTPRRLTCAGRTAAGIHTVRSRADVDRMLGEIASADRIVVIGAGYIGLEAAAVLSKLGKRVTVIEAQDRVLARVAGEPLSRFFEAEHRAHGVELLLATSVDCIEEAQGRVVGVRLTDGRVVAADMVIVGIGISPEIAPLAAAGAEVGNGVRVDAQCRTSLKDIYAIGDCAEHRNRFAGGAWIRLESVQNANDQAMTVAKAISGADEPYEAVPWFWSNQFDLRLQTVGLSLGFEEAVVRGEPTSRSFSVVYLKGGKVVALDCVNAIRDYSQGRRLVELGVAAERDRLADTAIPLKNLLPA